MMATTGPAVVFDRVTRRYGAVTALDEVTFEVPRGEMFGLIGPDGAGKTTAIRVLCGLLHADAGTVSVLGHHPVRDRRDLVQSVGYLSQRFSLYGDLSIDENIAFFAEIHGVRRYDERRERLLELTQLTPFRARLADRLSGGMKQKLALACTLVHEPRLVVLDEPTTGVDPVSRREFWKLLSEFLEQGITILVSTPYLDEAERCARVGLLHEGRVIALDSPDALRKSLPGALVEVTSDQPDAVVEALHAAPAVTGVQTFGTRVHVRLAARAGGHAAEGVGQALAARAVPVRRVRAIPPSLEDVFIERLSPDARGQAAVTAEDPARGHGGRPRTAE
jgi:ABC-2 type transport system ATP-binding protein